MAVVIVGLVQAIVGVLTGWLAPLVVNSRRPYGLTGDIVAGVVTMLVIGIPEYLWIMPWFNEQVVEMPGWLTWAAVIGDPWVGALIVLWIMRRVNPVVPEEREPAASAENAAE